MYYDNYLLNAALYRHTQTEMVNIVETLVKMKKKSKLHKILYTKNITGYNIKIHIDVLRVNPNTPISVQF